MSGLTQRNKSRYTDAPPGACHHRQISLTDPNARSMRGRWSLRCCGYNFQVTLWGWSCKLRCGCTMFPEASETARDASKATAEVACGRELCLDWLPRAVGSG